MTYTITDGIGENELSSWLADALKRYGTYENGGVNYKDAPLAPIIMCIIVCGDELLLVKRGYDLADAEGYWSVITGFIDVDKPIRDIAKLEIQEELSLSLPADNIQVGRSYMLQNRAEKRKYIIFPCLLRVLAKPNIVLDHEHTEFAWVKHGELTSYHILDDLPYGIDQALALEA